MWRRGSRVSSCSVGRTFSSSSLSRVTTCGYTSKRVFVPLVSSLKREAKPKSTLLIWRIDKPIARANIGTVAVEGEGGSSMTMLGSSRLTFFLKLLGASAFVFVLFFVGTLTLFPVADQFVLPWAARRTFDSKSKKFRYSQLAAPRISAVGLTKPSEASYFVGREKEIAFFTNEVKKQPSKIHILTGSVGKSSLAKRLADDLDKAIYLDFRCCSGAHSAVFELCYQMYRPLGLIGIALASYFKLVQIFINTMTSNNGQNHACMFNLFELMSYLIKGMRIKPVNRGSSGQYPVIFIDHLETLFECEATADDKALHQVYRSFLLSFASWALSICYDNKMAHVVFVTSSEYNAETYQKKLHGLASRTERFHLPQFTPEESIDFLEKNITEDRRAKLFAAFPPKRIVTNLSCSIVELEGFASAISNTTLEDCVQAAEAEFERKRAEKGR